MVKSVVAGRGWLVGAHRVRLCTELSDHLDLIATTWPIWTEIDVVVEVAQVPREIRVVGEDTDGVVMDVDLTAENLPQGLQPMTSKGSSLQSPHV